MAIEQRPDLGRALNEEGIGLCVFPAPDPLAFEAGIPAIMAVHDLQHRLHPEFPEVGSRSEWAIREYIYRNVARANNVVVLVDSEVGAEDFLSNYAEFGAAPERVKVLPFLPSPRIAGTVAREDVSEARQRLGLQSDYFFYPARFWPHKNHLRVVEAIALLKERGVEVDVVFAGGTDGQFAAPTYRKLRRFVKRARLQSSVRFLGYVPDQDMAPIYRGAKGLVMPTFFGPTNIPIIEAWSLDLPVVTSDIRGIREQVGDAAVLVDPVSTRSIAAGMEAVLKDADLRQRLISAGRARVAAYPPEAHAQRLREIVDEAIADLV